MVYSKTSQRRINELYKAASARLLSTKFGLQNGAEPLWAIAALTSLKDTYVQVA